MFFSSCACDHYLTGMNGLRSKRLYKKYVDKKVNPLSLGIFTEGLYKSLHYMYKERSKTFEKNTDSVVISNDYYIKFYDYP